MKIQPLSWQERLAGAILAILIGLAAFLVLALIVARAAEAAPVFDCHDIAMLAGGAADFRDAGAEVEKTVRIARLRHVDRTAAEMAVIEKEIRRAFKGRKQRLRVIAETYRRCRSRRGAMD